MHEEGNSQIEHGTQHVELAFFRYATLNTKGDVKLYVKLMFFFLYEVYDRMAMWF